MQAKLQHSFQITGALRLAKDLLDLLKSSNKPADSILQNVEKLRAEAHTIRDTASDEKSLNAEALHQIKKIRIKLTPDTLQQVRKDLDPLMSAQLRIQGWKSDCDKVMAVVHEIEALSMKRSREATGTHEEVTLAREISRASTEIAGTLMTIVTLIAQVFNKVNWILDSYLKPIREVAEKLARIYGQAF